jgi:hypothetical protein
VEVLEIEGLFWLPSEPKNRVAGRLTFDPVEGGALSLIGELNASGDVPRIIGVAGDGAYTLDSCFLRSHRMYSLVARQVFHVNRIYGGVKYDAGEEPVFDQFRAGLGGLVEWVQPQTIFEELKPGVGADGREYPYMLTSRPLDPQTVAISGGELCLRHIRGYSGDSLNERKLTQSFSLEVKFDQALPVADVIDVASDLQDLVTIGTHRIAAYTYMHLYHADLYLEPEAGGPRHQLGVRLLVPWHARQDADKGRLHRHNMAFTFGELGGIDGVARWMTTAKNYRSTLGRVMNTRYVKMFVEDRFLHRVAALEALHRKWKGTKSTTLVTRLVQLCDLAGKPIGELLPDVNAWCDRTKEERHNLAHDYGRTIHQDSAELLYSSEVAYWLFVLCLLRLADAPSGVFGHIVANPDFEWLRSRLK